MDDSGIVAHAAADRVKLGLARQMRAFPTPAEAILWQHLRAHRMAGVHFRRQHVISGYIADFYCHSSRLVVEVDGPTHDSAAAREYDLRRERALLDRGLRVLRVSNEDVLDGLPAVLALIRQAIDDVAA